MDWVRENVMMVVGWDLVKEEEENSMVIISILGW